MSTSTNTMETDGITLDQFFACLSHPTRRRVLTTIAAHNPRDEGEFESAAFAPDDESRDLFETDLYHTHLPHLDDAGFVDWDRDSDTVTHGPDFEDVKPLITLMEDHQDELPDDWP